MASIRLPCSVLHAWRYVYTIPYTCVRLQVYGMHFADATGRPYLSSGGRIPKGAPILVGCTDEIEELRPKSPPPGGDRS